MKGLLIVTSARSGRSAEGWARSFLIQLYDAQQQSEDEGQKDGG